MNNITYRDENANGGKLRGLVGFIIYVNINSCRALYLTIWGLIIIFMSCYLVQ